MAQSLALIDDDSAVRNSMRRLLLAIGFNVRVFASAEEFLATCHRREFECLLLDLQLGGMSGLDLVACLRKTGDSVPVIFLSGCPDALRVAHSVRPETPRLRKPIDPDLLLAVLEAIAPHGLETDPAATTELSAALLLRLEHDWLLDPYSDPATQMGTG